MKRGLLAAVSLVLLLGLSGSFGCDNRTAGESNFNLIFKYGVGARNELDMFKGTYTKDMVNDPSVTVPLSLSQEEMDRIYQKMVEIDFFDYPDRFSVAVPLGELTGMVTPYSSYYFKIEYNSRIKELWWDDKITNKDEKADRLRELIRLIKDIVEVKEEYKKLPEPSGGYL
jgi:hypothetical protein